VLRGWEALLAQRKELHSRTVQDYAWWDRAAQAAQLADNRTAIAALYGADNALPRLFDVVLVAGARNRLLYGRIDGRDSRAAPDDFAAWREKKIESEFLEITALKFREQLPELEAARRSPPLQPLSDPWVWHHVTQYRGHVRLLTLSPICEDHGYPVAEGFVLLGTRLDRLFEQARDNLRLADIHLSDTVPYSAYAYAALPGYRPGEAFYVAFEPETTFATAARQLLSIFLLLQILLTCFLLGFALPHFTLRPAALAPLSLPAPNAVLAETPAPLIPTRTAGTAPEDRPG
jgi:hypothetical protein